MAIMNPSKLRDVLDLLPYCNLSDTKKKAIEAIITKYLNGEIVPVVRCKDCKHGELDDSERDNYYHCRHHGCDWNDGEHFCGYGERKADV